MEAISEQRLALVNPLLRAKVQAAAAAAAAQGVYFRVACGLRTYEEENALWHTGRDANGNPIPKGQPGHGIVTNARGGYSNHNFGCAVDCYPFVQGETGALDLTDPNAPEFRVMVAALKAQGLAWGGDWESIVDEPHFQLANVPVTPVNADRVAFAKGGLPAVWALYEPKEETA